MASIYLFPSRDPDRHRTALRNCWRWVCRAAGLATEYTVIGKRGKPLKRWRPTFRVYDLRHSFASHLVNRGASLFLVGLEWTPLVTCPTGISPSGQCGNRGRKMCRLTFPCKRLTPFTAPLPRTASLALANHARSHIETVA